MTYRLKDVFTAIADPHRRQILDYLASQDMTAGSLADRFELSRPAVAKHLRVLRDSGLVTTEREGRFRIHRLQPQSLRVVRDWLSSYERFWDASLRELKAQVETEMRTETSSPRQSRTQEREP